MKLLTATFMFEANVCARAGADAMGSMTQIESTTALNILLIKTLLSVIVNEHKGETNCLNRSAEAINRESRRLAQEKRKAEGK